MRLQGGALVLLAAFLAFGAYAWRAKTLRPLRILYLALAAAGILLVLQQWLAIDLAKLLGISRGVDLLLYLFVIFTLFQFVTVAAALTRIERQFTELVRYVAIREARLGGGTTASAERSGAEPGRDR